MVEDKVRELTVSSERESNLTQETHKLKEQLLEYESDRDKMLVTLMSLKDKISGIEKHYGNDIMFKLKTLRQEVALKVEGPKHASHHENNG